MKLCEKDEKWLVDFVRHSLHFMPSVEKESHFLPFSIQRPFCVYDIAEMTDEQIDLLHELAPEAIQNCLESGCMIYAVDWNHNTILYDPLKPETAQCSYPTNPYFTKKGLCYFNTFYPNGDYFFFVDRFGTFGYLSHPWREEVWIFGTSLLQEFDNIYTQLGWKKKSRS